MSAFRALSVFRLARTPSPARPRVSARWLEYALQAAVVGWLCLWLMPSQAASEAQHRDSRPQPAATSSDKAA